VSDWLPARDRHVDGPSLRAAADLRARVLAAVERDPAPPRRSGIRRDAALLATGFAVAVLTARLLGVPHVGRRPAGYVVALAVAWAAVALVATLGAVARGGSMLGRPIAHRIAVSALTPVALFATSLLATAAWPQTVDQRNSLLSIIICAAFTALFALAPFIAFVLVLRRSDPVAPRLAGAALGAAAGAWGALGIELWCSRPTPWHVLAGHVAPVVVLALVGAWLGGAFLRVVAVRAKTG
jgi:hypothetical protein